MKVDHEKVIKVIRMIEAINDAQGNDTLDADHLDDLLGNAVSLAGIRCTSEEIEEIKKEIEYKYQIYNATPVESIISDYDQTNWYTDIKDTIEPKFWSRYRNYLVDEKNFSPSIVSTLGNDTIDNNLMNYIGDPKSDYPFLRRGLIIGDVQSGKTSTYIGFMCKAADAGYKVFILLTGTIESLRKQTQERVEEGFIGINPTDQERVGVGINNKEILATALTTRISDFNGKSDQIAMSLSGKDAVVFVIKKNTSVLTKLTNWLITMNADKRTKKIDLPMLLIDDEADNASVNTSNSKEDPTKINKLIRGLVDVFTKSNYVGFTATPFANVFIDPITTEEMENHDLFPEDFIVALPTPSNYIGAEDIFGIHGKYHSQLNFIEDAGRQKEDGWPFYYKHKKDWDDELPESLTDAIYAFYIANAIRDLRGDKNTDRSMLINISRFIITQYNIKAKVDHIHNVAYRAIKYDLPMSLDIQDKNPVLNRLYRVWEEQYSDTEFNWDDIKRVLFESIEEIQIKVVNSRGKSDKLEYHKGSALRVIAIGGLALSRGLTLEGLIVSYFFRNTSTYDVLMQMGRWFGYRKNYDDLFRIWIHEESAEWYAEIADATEQLKRDMGRMRDLKQKPKDFGIRVRNDSSALSITARNKMRNTRDEYEYFSYFGDIIETPYLNDSVEDNISNYIAVKNFVKEALDDGRSFNRMQSDGGHYVITDVNKYSIISLLRKLIISRYDSKFNPFQICSFLDECHDKSIAKWDIAFMEGAKTDDNGIIDIYNRIIYPVMRKFELDCERHILKIGSRGKVGGTTDGKIGITDFNGRRAEDIIQQARHEFINEYKANHKERSFDSSKVECPSNTWFKYVKDRKPLLIIYLMRVNNKRNESKALDEFVDRLNGNPITAFAIGLPKNDAIGGLSKTRYKANSKYNWFEMEEIYSEGEEE